MSNKNLPGRALRVIYDYWHEHNRNYPTGREVANALAISISHWGNLKSFLFRKKLLKPSKIWQFEFTQYGFEAMKANDLLELDAVKNTKEKLKTAKIPSTFEKKIKGLNISEDVVELPLLGSVRAGPGSTLDDLRMYSGNETISIPIGDLNPQKVYVMEVEGESMIHEGIYPGDYIIVEESTLAQTGENDLIVARYLSPNFNKKKREVVDYAISNPDNMEGPTLKYFKTEKINKETIYRLSWKTQARESEFKIYTRYIPLDEVGRVIAVYTPPRFRRVGRLKRYKK